tara:strand:- start:2091 stop:2285 length:195 start_codon:yes stop_codon:yes gene_type:complete
MKDTSKIRNGSLYFNKSRKRVEQVRSKLNDNSVLTSQKDGSASVARADELRRASKKEVEKYKNS